MIFEKYRRDKWLKKIEATFGPLDTLEGDIHALDSHHLLSIAKVAKRIDGKGSFNQDMMRLILKILGKDAVLAKELAVTDENRFSERQEQLVKEHKKGLINRAAEAAFKEIRLKIERDLPEGCQVDEAVCLDALKEIIIASGDIGLFKRDVPHDELSKQFEEQFYAEPEHFICDFQEWKIQRRQQLAEAAFTKIRSKLDQVLPEGCQVDETVCLNALKEIIVNSGDIEILKPDVPQDELSKQFDEQFYAGPERFIRGLNEWKVQKQKSLAEAIFNLIRPGVERRLIEECSVNETACLEALNKIILDSGRVDFFKKDEIPHDIFNIFKQFDEKFSADPDFFIGGLSEWKVQKRQHLAETIFKEMRPRLERDLLEGYSLNEAACVEALGKIIHDLGCFDLFKNEIPHDKIIKQFNEQFYAEPERFIPGLEEWKVQKQQKLAEAILNTIRPGLENGLLQEWDINKAGCIEALGKIILDSRWTDLFKNDEVPDDIFNIFNIFNIFKQFNEQLHANLEHFICDIEEWKDQRRQYLAETIFKEMRPRLEQDLSEGCKVDEVVCLNTLKKLIIDLGDVDISKREVPHDKISQQFDAQFHAEPERFIRSFSKWKQQRKQNITEAALNKILPQLKQKLPARCSFNEAMCVEMFGKIATDLGYLDVFKREISYDNISQQFHQQFHANPEHFISGLNEWRRKLAEDLFNEIRPDLEGDLSEGCKIDEDVCLDALKKLIIDLGDIAILKHDVAHDDISQQFDKQFYAKPERFIRNFSEWKQQRRQNIVEIALNKIRPKLEQKLPEGCSINKAACVEMLGKIVTDLGYPGVLKREVSYDTISQQFHQKIHSNPEQFISGLSEWRQNLAEALFKNEIRPELERDLPKGYSLKSNTCIEELIDIIINLGGIDKNKVPSDKILTQFKKKFRTNKKRFSSKNIPSSTPSSSRRSSSRSSEPYSSGGADQSMLPRR